MNVISGTLIKKFDKHGKHGNMKPIPGKLHGDTEIVNKKCYNSFQPSEIEMPSFFYLKPRLLFRFDEFPRLIFEAGDCITGRLVTEIRPRLEEAQ